MIQSHNVSIGPALEETTSAQKFTGIMRKCQCLTMMNFTGIIQLTLFVELTDFRCFDFLWTFSVTHCFESYNFFDLQARHDLLLLPASHGCELHLHDLETVCGIESTASRDHSNVFSCSRCVYPCHLFTCAPSIGLIRYQSNDEFSAILHDADDVTAMCQVCGIESTASRDHSNVFSCSRCVYPCHLFTCAPSIGLIRYQSNDEFSAILHDADDVTAMCQVCGIESTASRDHSNVFSCSRCVYPCHLFTCAPSIGLIRYQSNDEFSAILHDADDVTAMCQVCGIESTASRDHSNVFSCSRCVYPCHLFTCAPSIGLIRYQSNDEFSAILHDADDVTAMCQVCGIESTASRDHSNVFSCSRCVYPCHLFTCAPSIGLIRYQSNDEFSAILHDADDVTAMCQVCGIESTASRDHSNVFSCSRCVYPCHLFTCAPSIGLIRYQSNDEFSAILHDADDVTAMCQVTPMQTVQDLDPTNTWDWQRCTHHISPRLSGAKFAGLVTMTSPRGSPRRCACTCGEPWADDEISTCSLDVAMPWPCQFDDGECIWIVFEAWISIFTHAARVKNC